jgi:predicted membrane channel-forming protein YqfA (hemolysin III family)
MKDSTQQVPKWFLAATFVTITLFIIGTIINPEYHSMNIWKLAAIISSVISLGSLLIIAKRKKG